MITGAGRGLGRAYARLLASRGRTSSSTIPVVPSPATAPTRLPRTK
ncbi:hypothetical protein I553_8510 [Mycobacterium xenopi 4042]|uniref:Uncharacterized protein n=1 Tax=Mycobacterium xenopi 4042 TaxID=1299334 RepID=X8CJA5_MYCXE|nr:hypothetical protein I552_8162 [Mycobacterium xenopi 3993]EUA56462.1 hypothetical protein I553_8510 [Mycobacterium xenopi 4042]